MQILIYLHFNYSLILEHWHAHADLQFLLEVFRSLKNTAEVILGNDQKKKEVDMILTECEKLFIANQESTANLIKILAKENQLETNC